MARRLFLFLIACFMGTICNPYILAAADYCSVTDLNHANIVETVPIEPEPTPEPAPAPVITVATAPVMPVNNIQITGRTIQVVDVPDTAYDSGDHVNRYGGQFYYGHNSSAVFGSLGSLGIGSVFSITLNGVTTNYQVANVVIYEKNPTTGQLQLGGAGDLMLDVAYARSNGVQYSISIMTCAGTSYGNGDASHRLVVFANAI